MSVPRLRARAGGWVGEGGAKTAVSSGGGGEARRAYLGGVLCVAAVEPRPEPIPTSGVRQGPVSVNATMLRIRRDPYRTKLSVMDQHTQQASQSDQSQHSECNAY